MELVLFICPPCEVKCLYLRSPPAGSCFFLSFINADSVWHLLCAQVLLEARRGSRCSNAVNDRNQVWVL